MDDSDLAALRQSSSEDEEMDSSAFGVRQFDIADGAVGSNSSTDGVVDDERDTRLGCWSWYPEWLQRFATQRWYLVALSLIIFVQGLIVSGLVPVVLSSVERQFGFQSKLTGLLVSWFDGVVAVTVPFVTFYGHKSHRPKWMFRGAMFLAAGSVLFFLPSQLKKYTPAGSEASGGQAFCSDTNPEDSCAEHHTIMILLFLVASTVFGLGSSPVYTLGYTFLDDNTDPKALGSYLGVASAVSALGPAIGFVMGGAFLSIYVQPGEDTRLTPDSEGWVGAWWIPFLICALIAVISGLVMVVFPRQLPGTQWIRNLRKGAVKGPVPGKGFAQSLKQLMQNKTYLFNQLGASAEIFVVAGVGAFLPKYVETQFHMSASEASFVTGASIIVGVASGSFVGGYLQDKFRWTTLTTARNTFLFAFLAMLFSPIMFMNCGTIKLDGVNTNVPANFSASCSGMCHCSLTDYRPVCHKSTGVTYSSPCLAGCHTETGSGFGNCTCVQAGPTDNLLVSDGKCSGCGQLVPFLLLLFVVMFTTFLFQVPQTTVVLRCVPEDLRSFGLGVGSFIWRVLGAIPGPLIVGALLDDTCILWSQQCDGARGACWEYDSHGISKRFFGILFTAKLCSTTFFFLSWLFFRKQEKYSVAKTEESDAVFDAAGTDEDL